jgi:hypothetical protein
VSLGEVIPNSSYRFTPIGGMEVAALDGRHSPFDLGGPGCFAVFVEVIWFQAEQKPTSQGGPLRLRESKRKICEFVGSVH